MTLDFLRPLLLIGSRRAQSDAPSWGSLPSPRELEALRLLRDEQLRWYVSQHGQAFLRRELERRAGR